jgi:hypothetical protein
MLCHAVCVRTGLSYTYTIPYQPAMYEHTIRAEDMPALSYPHHPYLNVCCRCVARHLLLPLIAYYLLL